MTERLPPHALEKLLAAARPLADPAGVAGERVGKYRLVREIGRGGMGAVYEAEDPELGRRVALKLVGLAWRGDGTVRERFLREARAAARLSHPNIAAVYEASDEAIAMQFIDGVALSSLPRDDTRELVRLVRDAALAVHYAHEKGVIHRDLKPHNLLVEDGRVVVTDFGLAKDAAFEGSLSLSGAVLGTPGYMSPEQAEGRVKDVDPRTDVWGLGATLYDLLAGRPPFAERDVVRCLRAIVEQDPPAPRTLRPDVPRDLELVVLKCLAKEKERRYASARELAVDLTRWLDGDVVLAQPPSLGYRLSKFARRRRALLALGGIAALALVVALLATLARRAQREVSARALALSTSVANVLADAERHRRLGELELANARLDHGIAAAESFLAAHDVGEAHALLGRLLRSRGRSEDARRELDRSLELVPGLEIARLERGLMSAAAFTERAAREGIAAEDVAGLDPELARLRSAALADLAIVETASGLPWTDALLARAVRAQLTGDRASARAHLDEVLRLEPLHADAKIALSRLELSEGNDDAAMALAMSALDLGRGFGPAYLARSARPGAGAAGGQRDGAAGAPASDPGIDRTREDYQLRGTARLRLPGVEGGLVDFGAAVLVDPSDAMAHANRGLVHARRAAALAAEGRRDEALEAWDAAIEDFSGARTVDPELAGASNNLGVAHVERARLLEAAGRAAEAARERERAVLAFDEALRIAPRFELARQNRALSNGGELDG